MKKTILIITTIMTLCSFNDSFPQAYDGSFYGFFFGRQPSSRAEAMGRSLASVPGDVSACYFNPAGLAPLTGLNLWGSFANPYYELEEGNFVGFGATYQIKKFGVVGFTGEVFSPNEYVGIPGNDTGAAGNLSYNTGVPNVRLTYSSEIIKDLFLGANVNTFWPLDTYRQMSVGNEKGVSENVIVYLDFGVMKSFTYESGLKKLTAAFGERKKHTFTLGSSITNLNFAGYSISDGTRRGALPSVFRLGISYKLGLYQPGSTKYFGLSFLANIEYEEVLNSQYYEGLHSGFEFGFADLLYLRAGYYSQDNRDCDSCVDRLSEFTFGAGVNINVVPSGYKKYWGIKLDYTNLRQPPLTTFLNDPARFSVYTAQLYFVF